MSVLETSDSGQDKLPDGRKPGDWCSRYKGPAKKAINCEAFILFLMLVFSLILITILLGLDDQSFTLSVFGDNSTISFRWLTIFVSGFLGSTAYSIKWLIHAVAKTTWHLDRQYWRLLTPMLGGVYACVILALWTRGLISPSANGTNDGSLLVVAPLSFLVGYFSDGVSGLLTNVASAAFGTIRGK